MFLRQCPELREDEVGKVGVKAFTAEAVIKLRTMEA
jgi:hypothetical protein